MKPQIDDAELYNRDYFNGYYLKDPKRELQYLQEEVRVRERSNFGTILDVGCGVGGFLSVFDDRWEKHGYDPSEFASDKAAKKGIETHRNLNSINSECMDVIILRGVLQHMSKPIETLQQVTRILRPGGLLVILATPNTDGIVYKLWGNLPPLDAPRNWCLFGAKSLTNILKRFEYKDIEVLYPYWGTPYAHPLRDLWNFVLSLIFGWRKFPFPGSMMEVYARKP